MQLQKKSFILLAILALNGCAGQQTARKEIILPEPATRELSAESSRTEIPAEKLSLDQALQLAMQHNRALQSALTAEELAYGQTLEAYQGVLPNINLQAQYRRQDTDVRYYGGQANPLGQLDNRTATLNVIQPLFKGGAGLAGLKAAHYYESLVDEQTRLTLQQTIFTTMQGYYQVLLAQEQVKVTTTYTELAEAHLKDVKIKRQFGAASDFNVLRSEVELSNARSSLISYQNQLHTARASLFKTIGIHQTSQVVFSDELEYLPLEISAQEILQRAMQNRPDLSMAELSSQIQEESLSAQRSAYSPQVNAFFNRSYGDPDPYLPVNDSGRYAWNAGVRVDIPIFDGLGREGRIAQQKARLKQSQIALLDTREQALFEVRNAVADLQDAAELVESQRLSVDQAAEGLRLAEIGYREGSLDQVSVLDAQAALTQARLTYYQSLYAHSMARINLELVQGILEI